jgi:hypothetical protein
MSNNQILLWYGTVMPLPGVAERFAQRGYRIHVHQPEPNIAHFALAGMVVAVFNHIQDVASYLGHIRTLVIQGARIVFAASRSEKISILATLENEPVEYPWEQNLIFIPDFTGTHFDNFIFLPSAPRAKNVTVVQNTKGDKLNREEEVLLRRAFPKAEQLHVETLTGGLSGAKVLIVHESRREASIAHWAQPRLVKFGNRFELEREVGHMKAVSPFVPFELRPNLDVYVEGYRLAVFVADFVEKSESLLAAARAGRGEAAISNLFNRTLYRWRGRGWQNDPRPGSLAVAAKRLNLMDVGEIHPGFLRIERFERRGFDLPALWAYLESLSIKHRSASIHGDLHGENIRVRGDDAILIDFGSVKGAQHGDAPLCFDVAMLEVALVFSADENAMDDEFEILGWEDGIRPYYRLDAIRRTPKREGVPNPVSWLFDCIQRIRAFGIYDQTDEDEYAVALAIALWRWCRWEPRTKHEEGRRVIGLEIGCEIIQEIRERRNESKEAA